MLVILICLYNYAKLNFPLKANECFLVFNQASWCLKTRALTEQVYVDEVDVDEEGIAEMLMDDNAVAQLPR